MDCSTNSCGGLEDLLYSLSLPEGLFHESNWRQHSEPQVSQAAISQLQKVQNVQYPLPITIRPPIDKLPSEILGEIFKIFVRTKQELLITTGVCNRWRDAAHATPQLWTDISFSITLDTPLGKVDWAQSWIERSGGLPINIKLSFDARKSSALEPFLARVAFGLIEAVGQRRNITRCHKLNLAGPPAILSKFCGNNEGASNLVTLELSSPVLGGSTPVTAPFNFGQEAAPANLILSNVRLRTLEIKWSNLAKFLAYDFFFDELLELFTLAPMLEECVADALDPIRRPRPLLVAEEPVITHLKLSSLNVCFHAGHWEMRDLEYFFRRINMCNLANLDCNFNIYRLPANALIGFIRRSRCSLQYLRMRTNGREPAYIWGNHMINIAMATPNLVQLCLEEIPVNLQSDAFLNRLCMDSNIREILPNERPILPVLETLILTMHVGFPWRFLPGFFGTSRTAQPAFKRPLREVRITILRNFPVRPGNHCSCSRRFKVSLEDWHEFSRLSQIEDVLLEDWETYDAIKGLQHYLEPNGYMKLRVDVGMGNYVDLLDGSRRYLEITNVKRAQ